MYVMEQLARDRTRDNIELAEQLRPARRLRALRRARRMEVRAERQLLDASRRAAKFRRKLEYLDY
jgi:hypothetical protein